MQEHSPYFGYFLAALLILYGIFQRVQNDPVGLCRSGHITPVLHDLTG